MTLNSSTMDLATERRALADELEQHGLLPPEANALVDELLTLVIAYAEKWDRQARAAQALAELMECYEVKYEPQ